MYSVGLEHLLGVIGDNYLNSQENRSLSVHVDCTIHVPTT